jgi:hypothetical protein
MSRWRCLIGAKSDRLSNLSAGGASRVELFNVRVDVPRALSGRRWRIVLALLRGVLQFIRSDEGRDGRTGDRGNGQVLGEATKALFWWPLGTLQL